ncbi:MAG: trimeric intracellular cation channel family protein [Nitrospirae bacterium]|nr:trimeric intracellular cation channel family protein [Nitrospirota bacterium]
MNTLIKTIEVIGIIAFALTGIYEARKKGMDIIGVYAVAMITAFGGGSLRDIILNRHPLFWIEHYGYTVLLLGLSIVSVLVIRNFFAMNKIVKTVLVLDALGLGLFSASGASVANQLGSPWFISALLGVTTGVFGGVMRDIICNEIPHVFTRTELYATCAFAGACSYLVIFSAGGNEIAAVLACIALTFVLRMLAIRYKIRLPI